MANAPVSKANARPSAIVNHLLGDAGTSISAYIRAVLDDAISGSPEEISATWLPLNAPELQQQGGVETVLEDCAQLVRLDYPILAARRLQRLIELLREWQLPSSLTDEASSQGQQSAQILSPNQEMAPILEALLEGDSWKLGNAAQPLS